MSFQLPLISIVSTTLDRAGGDLHAPDLALREARPVEPAVEVGQALGRDARLRAHLVKRRGAHDAPPWYATMPRCPATMAPS